MRQLKGAHHSVPLVPFQPPSPVLGYCPALSPLQPDSYCSLLGFPKLSCCTFTPCPCKIVRMVMKLTGRELDFDEPTPWQRRLNRYWWYCKLGLPVFPALNCLLALGTLYAGFHILAVCLLDSLFRPDFIAPTMPTQEEMEQRFPLEPFYKAAGLTEFEKLLMDYMPTGGWESLPIVDQDAIVDRYQEIATRAQYFRDLSLEEYRRACDVEFRNTSGGLAAYLRRHLVHYVPWLDRYDPTPPTWARIMCLMRADTLCAKRDRLVEEAGGFD